MLPAGGTGAAARAATMVVPVGGVGIPRSNNCSDDSSDDASGLRLNGDASDVRMQRSGGAAWMWWVLHVSDCPDDAAAVARSGGGALKEANDCPDAAATSALAGGAALNAYACPASS